MRDLRATPGSWDFSLWLLSKQSFITLLCGTDLGMEVPDGGYSQAGRTMRPRQGDTMKIGRTKAVWAGMVSKDPVSREGTDGPRELSLSIDGARLRPAGTDTLPSRRAFG